MYGPRAGVCVHLVTPLAGTLRGIRPRNFAAPEPMRNPFGYARREESPRFDPAKDVSVP
jgi:hypothetical protein